MLREKDGLHTVVEATLRICAEVLFARILDRMSAKSVTHGRPSSYQAGCRCQDCKRAQRHYTAARKAGLTIYEFNDLWIGQSWECASCRANEAALVVRSTPSPSIVCGACRDVLRAASFNFDRLSACLAYAARINLMTDPRP